MADKEYSVGIDVSVGATLDEASVKEVERKVQDRLAKSVEVNVKLSEAAERSARMRAERGLPPRTPKGAAKDINFNDLFKAELFRRLELPPELRGGVKLALPKFDVADPASGIGKNLEIVGGQFSELKKKLKETEDDLDSDAEDIARMDFGGRISDELEVLKDAVKASNTFMAEISKATGVKSLNLDYLKDLDGFEAEVSSLTDGLVSLENGNVDQALLQLRQRFALIGDTLVPNAVLAQEAFLEAARMAQMLGVPVAGIDTRFSISQRQGRGVPVGADRSSLGDSKQAERVTAAWQKQITGLVKNPETFDATIAWMTSLIDSIAEDIYEQAAQAMQDSADYFAGREFKGGEFDTGYITKSESADISTGSNEMGYWLEDFVSKFRELVLKRGFEPGSEIQLAERLRSIREQQSGGQLSFQEKALFDALEGQFAVVESGLQDFNANLAQSANLIADQILNNPAIVTTKPLGGGAQKEIKELTADLPAQIKQIQELGTAALGASEAITSLRDQAKEASNAQLAVDTAQFDLEGNQRSIEYLQQIANDETKDLQQRAAAAEALQAKVLEQAALEQKLIELKAKLTAAQIASLEAEQSPTLALESGFAVWQRQFLERLGKLGNFDTAAFDTEFNDLLLGIKNSSWITEAAITVKDQMGQIVDLFEMVQAPPMQDWQKTPGLDFQPGSRGGKRGLDQIAQTLGIEGGVGSLDPAENYREYYDKIQRLLFVLETVGKNAPILGSNAGSTDLNRLGKVIEWLNNNREKFAPELPALRDITPGMLTIEPDKIVKSSDSEAARVIGAGKKSLSDMMIQIMTHYSHLLTEEQKAMFRLAESGLEVKVTDLKTGIDKWLPAHYAKVDNRIALAVKSVLDQLMPVESSMAQVTEDYAARRSAEAEKNRVKTPRRDKPASSGSGDVPPSGGDVPPSGGDTPTGGDSAENLEKTFLAYSQIQAILGEMAEYEKVLANAALVKLQKQAEYQKLLEKEKGIREQMAEDPKTSRYILPEGMEGPTLPLKQMPLFPDLAKVITEGRELERLTFEQVKASARHGDVAKKFQNTAAMTVDTQIELEKASKKAFSSEIQAQMREQAQAAKQVEAQTKSLINQWVTGRYALYDVGNAYAGVARQLWAASRQIFNITQSYRTYETAFTSVERAIQPLATSIEGVKEETGSLKNAFIELSEQIPISFEEISRIATLGAQMGVSASGIVNFTKVVAEFSSVTGVAADTVAQKFGRIAELANVDYSQFTNLGSSILFAGMNAVATEPEIMTLAESIAAVSSQAGLVPSEIVGMATALASTGIQAEQARGVFTRVFADIDRAVSTGGAGLNNFAAVAGMSSEDFKKAWGTEGASYDVFRALLGGLGATEDMTSAFDKLNIVETREVNTLTRLAENLNVVDQAISDATGSFESGAFLGSTFEKTVDNLDAKIQVFNNNLKSLTEELSKGMASNLKDVIDILNGFLQLAKEVAKNPLFSTLATWSLGTTALGAAATLGVSAFAKLVAQIYAFRVAAINTANNPQAVSGMTGMLKQLTGWGGGLMEMRNELKGAASDARGVLTPMSMGARDSFADMLGRRVSKFKMLGDEVRRTDRVKTSLLKTENIYLASTRKEADSVTQIIAARADEINSIEMRTGAIQHSYDATVAEQSAIKSGEATIESVNAARAKERASMLAAIGGRTIYVETINGETRALTANQYAELESAAAADRAAGVKNSESQARLKNIQAINLETKAAAKTSKMQLGPTASLIGLATGLGTALAAFTAISTVVGFISAAIEKSKINLLESGGGLASLRDAIKQDTIEYNKLTEAQKASSNEFEVVKVKTKTYTAEVDANAVAIGAVTGASSSFVEKNKKVIEGIEDSTMALGKNTREWLANAAIQDENLNKALEEAPTLFKDVAAAGYDLKEIINQIFENPDITVEELLPGIDKAMADAQSKARTLQDQAISSSDPEVAADFQKQSDAAFDYARRLQLLKEVVASLQTTLSTAVNKNEVFNAIAEALGVTSEAAEELEEDINGVGEALRTVLDYASDLSGILARVVELEFGKQMSRDDITTGWRDMAESIDDAKKSIEDANNEIKGLTADKSILEYQLTVAERYGDQARAAKIRAELAKINKQITESEEDLAEATAASSTALSGDSDAAIKNRSALLGMVSTYQSHIEMLAKLGMSRSELEESTDVLKRQFLAEAKALGFSGEELAKYAGLFDNFADVTSDAPRDVDIEVALGLTAAEQAIEEFISKDRSTTVDADVDTDDAEIDINKFLNKERVLTPAELKQVNTLVANGTLEKWLYLEREFGAPKVTNITADAADRKIRDWLAQSRSLGAINIHNLYFQDAEAKLQAWLNQGRKLSVDVVTTMKSSSLAQAQATAAYELARNLSGSNRDSYNEMGRMLTKVANDLRGRGLAAGGYVSGPGSSTSDSIPARLSNGEFVMQASAVKTYGVDFFNALNQQRVGFAPASNTGGAAMQQGPSIVFLSPEDRQLLRQFGDRPVNLYADSTKIAEVANAGNTQMSRRGSR